MSAMLNAKDRLLTIDMLQLASLKQLCFINMLMLWSRHWWLNFFYHSCLIILKQDTQKCPRLFETIWARISWDLAILVSFQTTKMNKTIKWISTTGACSWYSKELQYSFLENFLVA